MSFLSRRGLSLAPLLSLVLLAGIWLEWQAFHLPSANAQDYHARVQAVAEDLPYRVEDWEGEDIEVPRAAERLLKPNVLKARMFRNAATGERAALIVIQSSSAYDMQGHYPPICYRHHGWELRERDEALLQVGGLAIPTAVYRFTRETSERFDEKVIYNFFVRPDGALESGREGVVAAAADVRSRFFGAMQIQVDFPDTMAPARREAVARTLLSATLPTIAAVRAGEVEQP